MRKKCSSFQAAVGKEIGSKCRFSLNEWNISAHGLNIKSEGEFENPCAVYLDPNMNLPWPWPQPRPWEIGNIAKLKTMITLVLFTKTNEIRDTCTQSNNKLMKKKTHHDGIRESHDKTRNMMENSKYETKIWKQEHETQNQTLHSVLSVKGFFFTLSGPSKKPRLS